MEHLVCFFHNGRLIFHQPQDFGQAERGIEPIAEVPQGLVSRHVEALRLLACPCIVVHETVPQGVKILIHRHNGSGSRINAQREDIFRTTPIDG